MRTSMLLTMTLLGILLSAGCIQLESSLPWLSGMANATEDANQTDDGIIDCGSDMDCLIDASEECEPAKLNYSSTLNFFGINQTTTYYYEIKGNESDKCVLYNRIEKIELSYPDEMSDDYAKQMDETYDEIEGKDRTCRFEEGELKKVLKKWKAGTFSSFDLLDAECEGSLYDMYSSSGSTSNLSSSKITINASFSPSKNVQTTCPSGYTYTGGMCKKDEPEYSCKGYTSANIYSKSTTSFKEDSYSDTVTDHCKDSDTVVEYYCDGYKVKTQSIDCPSGYSCSDGACRKISSCTGSSSYGSLYVKTNRYLYQGSSSTQYSDYCKDSSTVYKAYCNGDTVSYGQASCPSGYSCSDGACVKKQVHSCSGPTSWSLYYANTVYYNNGKYTTIHTDYCYDSYWTVKYYCNGNYEAMTYARCPSGYQCSNGGCVKSSTSSTSSGCSSGSCGSTSSSSSSGGCSSGTCGSGSSSSGSSSSSGGCSGGSCPANKGPTTSGSNDLQISGETMQQISKAYSAQHIDVNYVKLLNLTLGS